MKGLIGTRFAIANLIAAAALPFTAMPLAAQSNTAAAPSYRDAPVTEAELRNDIAALASDDFGGRFPGTEGQTKTLSYIADHLQRAGFVGAADGAGGWYQPVPLVDLRYGSSSASFTNARGRAIAKIDVIARAPAGGEEAT